MDDHRVYVAVSQKQGQESIYQVPLDIEDGLVQDAAPPTGQALGGLYGAPRAAPTARAGTLPASAYAIPLEGDSVSDLHYSELSAEI